MKGAAAEEQADRYLRQQGLQTLARNWRCPGGELDLILRDGDTLVIAEVRQRSRDDFGDAAASVDARKRSRLIRATQLYLAQHPQHADAPVRFDVIALDASHHITWLKAAFDADG